MRATTVVVASDDDLSADSVMRHMHPEDTIRLDPGKLNSAYSISSVYSPATGAWQTQIEGPGRSVPVGKLTSVWWRKPTPGHALTGDQAWAAEENTAALLGMLRSSECEVWVNDPGNNARAAIKAPQLTLAKRLGMNVPDTVVTNDPAVASAFVERCGGAVSKAQQQRYTKFLPATIVEPGADLTSVAGTMHQFQAIVRKQFDVRVTVIGDTILPCRITSSQLDWRIAPREDQKYAPIAVHGPLVKAINAYMRAEQLVFATFDFAADATGMWWFLECNPNGEFGFIEAAAGIPVSRLLAEYLRTEPAQIARWGRL